MACCLACFGSNRGGGSRWQPLWRRRRKKELGPSVSAPLHLLLKDHAESRDHIFLKKYLKRPKTCQRCHEPITKLGSICRVCKFICHKACETNEEGAPAEEDKQRGIGVDGEALGDAPPRRRRRPLDEGGGVACDEPTADGNDEASSLPPSPSEPLLLPEALSPPPRAPADVPNGPPEGQDSSIPGSEPEECDSNQTDSSRPSSVLQNPPPQFASTPPDPTPSSETSASALAPHPPASDSGEVMALTEVPPQAADLPPPTSPSLPDVPSADHPPPPSPPQSLPLTPSSSSPSPAPSTQTSPAPSAQPSPSSRDVSPVFRMFPVTLGGESRFMDTSLLIHRQWLRSRRQQPSANPAVADSGAIDPSPESSPVANNVGALPLDARTMPARGWQDCDSLRPESSPGGIVREDRSLEGKPKSESGPAVRCVHKEPVRRTIAEEKHVSMELTYVTERIIALWFPVMQCRQSNDTKKSIEESRIKLMAEAASMLRIKHADTCMIFDLSTPSEDHLDCSSGSLGIVSQALGWPGTSLAPPLERLCSACKHIESWLSSSPQHVAVLYSRELCCEERIGVVISAYLTYSSICGSEEQALDRFAMRRFFQDKIGGLKSPSNVRYVGYFSGLLSGDIRMNAEPLFLTHVVIQGAPMFDGIKNEESKCIQCDLCGNDVDTSLHSNCTEKQQSNLFFFLKIYQQGLTLVYTSPVYKLNGSTNQLTISLENIHQAYFQSSSFPLHLRGDVLIKGYYLCQHCSSGSKCQCNGNRNSSSPLHRHVLFQCQFHTCAVANQLLRYSRKELDEVGSEKVCPKYPPDGGTLDLYFSGSSEAWPSPTPSIPLVYPRIPSPFTPSIYAQPSLSSSAYSFPSMDEEEEQFAIGGVVAWDSMEALSTRRRRRGDGGAEESTGVDESVLSSAESVGRPHHHRLAVREEEERVGHLTGPLDGSLYATVSKSPPAPVALERKRSVGSQKSGGGGAVEEAGRSMDLVGPRTPANREISHPTTATHAFHHHQHQKHSDIRRQEVLLATPSSSSTAEDHARLDELLGDMLMTVENIPDLAAAPSPTPGPLAAEGAAVAAATGAGGGRRSGEEAALPVEGAGRGREAWWRGEGEGVGGATASTGEEDIPYHARQDSRPFTYGAVPERVAERRRLAVEERSAGDNGGDCCAEEEDDEGVDGMRAKQQQAPGLESPGLVRKVSSAGQRAAGGGKLVFEMDGGKSPVRSGDGLDWRKDTVDLGSPSPESYTGLTWLQRQQQKLRDRREGRLRQERVPQEYRLLSELRTYQRSSSVSGAQTLPSSGRWHGRDDGYMSDTTLLVGGGGGGYSRDHNGSGDEWDEGRGKGDGGEVEWTPEGRRGGRVPTGNYSLPLRINTADEEKVMTMSSEPGSPLLPRRSVSRETTSRYASSNRHVITKQREENTLRTISSGVQGGGREWHVDGERPFVAVKRAHEQRSKGSLGSLDEGMTTQISQSRDDSLSSWATASVTWGEDDDDVDGEGLDGIDGRRSRVRPQTPAFPVQPRTPYSNGSITPVSNSDHQQRHVLVEVNVQGNSAGLPPKSPTTMRKDRSHVSVSPESQHHGSHHRSHSMSNGGSTIQSLPYHSTLPVGGQKQQFNEHQEVSPAHVKFVRDTSRFWYKPTITREEAIAMLKDKQPGTFVVRDSNSFPGAFGLALKVATPPANISNRLHSSPNATGDMSSELVRHFLIEPTSRGVKLKGCANEPVFSSLSALVYQHSLTAMALPCRLLLPEADPSPGKAISVTDGTVTSNQVLLQQGAACNVLYLASVDTESLTGPQAIRRAVADLFSRNPIPAPTVVHFKVSSQGITLTDNKRKLFFRRHYPVNAISHCGLDPDDRRWTEKSVEFGVLIRSNRCFGFVARKPSTKADNQCHVFAELDPEQPATAIVNFVTRVMMAGTVAKASNIV